MIRCGVKIVVGQEWFNLEGMRFEVLRDIGEDLFVIRIKDLNLETVYHISLFTEFIG